MAYVVLFDRIAERAVSGSPLRRHPGKHRNRRRLCRRVGLYPLGPLIGAGWGVARPVRLQVFPPDGKNVRTAHEEPSKKRVILSTVGEEDVTFGAFVVGAGNRISASCRRPSSARRSFERGPFGIEQGNLRSNTGDLILLSVVHERVHYSSSSTLPGRHDVSASRVRQQSSRVGRA